MTAAKKTLLQIVALCTLHLSCAQYNGPFSTSITSSAPVSTLLSAPGDPGTTTLDANYLDAYPGAVCNDGTPAAYYMSKGMGSGSNTWVVFLEGSMFCWDANSCGMRNATKNWWTGSTDWKPQMAQGGLFSNVPSESPFYNANLVWVKYCSSDLWTGSADASYETYGFYFKGFRIITSTIQSLMDEHGMGSEPGGRLLFGGCSAGALGAMNALDTVAAMVPQSMSVLGLLDAAALLDIWPAKNGWPWSPLLEPLQNLTAELLAFDQPELPASCLAKFPDANWKCIWGSFRLPLLSTPYFLTASQFDSFEISYDCDNYVPFTPQQLAFVDSFQPAARALFEELPETTALFSSTCLTHCLTDQATFYTFTVNGITPRQAIEEWFFEHERVRVISNCTGYSCTNECGLNSQGLPCNMGTAGCKIYPGPTEGAYPPPGPQMHHDQGKPQQPQPEQPKNGGGGGGNQQQQQQKWVEPAPQQAAPQWQPEWQPEQMPPSWRAQDDVAGEVQATDAGLEAEQQRAFGDFMQQQQQQQQQQ